MESGSLVELPRKEAGAGERGGIKNLHHISPFLSSLSLSSFHSSLLPSLGKAGRWCRIFLSQNLRGSFFVLFSGDLFGRLS